MNKQYVFWRHSSTGVPDRKGEAGFDPTILLAELGRCSKVGPDAKVSFSWKIPDFHRIGTALRSALAIVSPNGEELNENDLSIIIWSAQKSAAKREGSGKAISPDVFLEEANRAAFLHFSKPEKEYVLVGTLSIDTFPCKKIAVQGCHVFPIANRSKFQQPKELRTILNFEPAWTHLQRTKYKRVGVITKGRTASEAAARAVQSLNLLRGIWSLIATYGSWSIAFGGSPKPRPIGILHAGPIYTLHERNGNVLKNIYWYERTWRGDSRPFKPSIGWPQLEKQRRRMMRRISRLPYGKTFGQLVVRYVNALDQTDHDVAFLQMWGILERVTNTIGLRYEKTIERAVWPLRNRALEKSLLNCMRLRRNRYVHGGVTEEEPDQAVYAVKSIVDRHLFRLLENDFDAQSIEEYAEHLTLPTEPKALFRRKKMVAKAVRLLPKEKLTVE